MIENKPDYTRDENELQEFLLFSMMVAGKNAKIVCNKLNQFAEDVDPNGDGILSACAQLDQMGMLEEKIREHKLGNYTRFLRFVREAFRKGLKIGSCSIDELETLFGIGPKTSRFFVSFTRKGCRYAILDRHVLAWLRDQGIKAPKTTPTDRRKYLELEKTYLELVGDKDPSQTDYQIWLSKRRDVKCN